MSIIKAMNLKKYYITDTYEVRALDGVSLVVEERVHSCCWYIRMRKNNTHEYIRGARCT